MPIYCAQAQWTIVRIQSDPHVCNTNGNGLLQTIFYVSFLFPRTYLYLYIIQYNNTTKLIPTGESDWGLLGLTNYTQKNIKLTNTAIMFKSKKENYK